LNYDIQPAVIFLVQHTVDSFFSVEAEKKSVQENLKSQLQRFDQYIVPFLYIWNDNKEITVFKYHVYYCSSGTVNALTFMYITE